MWELEQRTKQQKFTNTCNEQNTISVAAHMLFSTHIKSILHRENWGIEKVIKEQVYESTKIQI